MTEPSHTDNELVRLARLVKLYRDLQTRHDDGERSPALASQLLDLGARVDKSVKWVLSHRQQSLPLKPPEKPR